MIEEFKKRYEDACSKMNEAVEKEQAARNAYLESRQTRAGHIHAKTQSILAEIDAEKEANTLRPQQIANALGNGNDELAAEIEKEIGMADGRIASLVRKRELFENTVLSSKKWISWTRRLHPLEKTSRLLYRQFRMQWSESFWSITTFVDIAGKKLVAAPTTPQRQQGR